MFKINFQNGGKFLSNNFLTRNLQPFNEGNAKDTEQGVLC